MGALTTRGGEVDDDRFAAIPVFVVISKCKCNRGYRIISWEGQCGGGCDREVSAGIIDGPEHGSKAGAI